MLTNIFICVNIIYVERNDVFLEIHERILEFRKSLKLSRDAFGEKLGVSRDVIANIELNRLSRPEQKEPLYKLICKIYGLNEEWLLYGTGEQFADLEEDIYTKATTEIGVEDDKAREAIIKYWKLSKEDKELFWKFTERFLN